MELAYAISNSFSLYLYFLFRSFSSNRKKSNTDTNRMKIEIDRRKNDDRYNTGLYCKALKKKANIQSVHIESSENSGVKTIHRMPT